MLGDAFNVIYLAPTALIWPGAAIAVTVASLILLGNGLRDAVQGVSFAPKRRRSKRARPASHRATRVTSREHSPATVMPGGSPHALEVRNLRIGYPQPDGTDRVVVHDVSFTIDRGEVRGLVGESGSGKSQTAFAVLGLLPQGGTVLGGEIILDGVDVLTLPPRERRALLGRAMGYIPQEPMSNLDPAFTIGHQLIWPLMNHGMTKKSATQKILGLLAEVGIPDPPRTFGSYPHQVSGGMAQRVLIAGAIAGDPELLIADEATTALDVTVQAEVLTLLRRLQQSRNMAVLMVTHNFGVVADICDSVAVMRGGRIIESAPAIELFANPQHEYTVSLLAATLEDAEPRPRLGTSTARLTGRNPS